MSKRKLTEVDKAYIEKFASSKSANDIVKELKKAGIMGIGVATVQQYISEISSIESVENISVEIENNMPSMIDPTELAGKHERGGVITMTQGLSELLDETEKGKPQVRDFRGKVAKIRKDRPTPKGIKIDE